MTTDQDKPQPRLSEDFVEVKPRDLGWMKRCPNCKSNDRLRPTSPPMFHPAHPGQRCSSRLTGEEQCECGKEDER